MPTTVHVQLDDEDLLRAVEAAAPADPAAAFRFDSRLIGALASALQWLPGGAETFLRCVEVAEASCERDAR